MRGAVVLIACAACAPLTYKQAEQAFASSHPSCKGPNVRELPELERPAVSQYANAPSRVYEVTGCDDTVIYPCFDAAKDADGSATPARCAAPDWCEHGACFTAELAARHAFEAQHACPLASVTTARQLHRGPAADAANPPDDDVVLLASGCGAQATYSCRDGDAHCGELR